MSAVPWGHGGSSLTGDVVLQVLTEAVREITGHPDAHGRASQVDLTLDVVAAIAGSGGQMTGRAPVGSGKSFALLAPAMAAAALDGRRTVISTESLSLQNQILTKDAPVVERAVERVTGYAVTTAVLKGWGNYPCAVACLDLARAFAAATKTPAPAVESASTWADALERVAAGRKGQSSIDLGEGPFPRRELRDLLVWALRALASDAVVDRAAYPGACTDQMWQTISVSRAECVGDTCPLFEVCVPVRARARVSEADVIVTNHSLLAIQAANSAPVVVGNRGIGPVHHVMVDEAHSLASVVRSQGAGEVSGRRVRSAVGAVGALLATGDKSVDTLLDDGRQVADLVEAHLNRGCKVGETKAVPVGGDPLGGIGESVRAWAAAAVRTVQSATEAAGPGAQVKARRVVSRLDGLRDAVAAVSEHSDGVARWVERSGETLSAAVAKSSPVDVAPLVAGNLWSAPVPLDDDGLPLIGELDIVPDETGEGPGTYALSVVAVSGTLQPGAPRELGMRGKTRHHASPLAGAYQSSLLLVPKPTLQEIETISTATGRAGKRRLTMSEHAAWATGCAVELVEAAGGRALVLTATSSGGQALAASLRMAAAGRWPVMSQWDGENVAQLVATWRANETSVLVGTRSLMTGTDAPGMTNVLTIIDRVPRAPQNPVDEARAELFMTRLQSSVWQARDEVYSRDAALRLEQAAGRLIRSTTDLGVVALLDPRLLKSTPLAYAETTRRIYMGALEEFTNKTSSVAQACEFLRSLVAGRTRAAA